MSPTQQCRLCLNISQDQSKLYNEPEVCRITLKYFDQKFLNLRNHLEVVCLSCWNHLKDFQNFQNSVYETEGKFFGEDGNVVVKIEKSEYQNNAIIEKGSIADSLPVVRIEIADLDLQTKSPKYETEERNPNNAQSEFISLPKLELVDVPEDSEFISDDDMPLSNYISPNKAQQPDEGLDFETTSDNEDTSRNVSETMSFSSSDCSRKLQRDSESVIIDNKTLKNIRSLSERDKYIALWKPTVECCICDKSFDRFTELRNHFTRYHHKKKFTIWCCKQFRNRPSFEEHIRMHLDPNTFKCEWCKATFKFRITLERHKCPNKP